MADADLFWPNIRPITASDGPLPQPWRGMSRMSIARVHSSARDDVDRMLDRQDTNTAEELLAIPGARTAYALVYTADCKHRPRSNHAAQSAERLRAASRRQTSLISSSLRLSRARVPLSRRPATAPNCAPTRQSDRVSEGRHLGLSSERGFDQASFAHDFWLARLVKCLEAASKASTTGREYLGSNSPRVTKEWIDIAAAPRCQ
jgi:hypothetical protein